MFLYHDFNTRSAYWVLTANSLIGIVTIALIAFQLITSESATFMYMLISVLSVMLILNIYFAYRIYKLSKKALVLCLWLYGLQIVGFETEQLMFSMSFGLQLNFSWSFDRFSFSVNLAAIIILFIVYSALKSVSKQS